MEPNAQTTVDEQVQRASVGPQQLDMLTQIEYSISNVSGLRFKLKNAREMLESELMQSEEYKETKIALKNARDAHKQAKFRRMSAAVCRDLADQIDSIKADLKVEQSSFGATLNLFAENSKQDSIVIGDDTYKIVKSAKVKKEPKPRRKKSKLF